MIKRISVFCGSGIGSNKDYSKAARKLGKVLSENQLGLVFGGGKIGLMGEIAKLTAGSNGSLDPADFNRTVSTLLAGGSDPVITKEPEGAWTHAITDKALN